MGRVHVKDSSCNARFPAITIKIRGSRGQGMFIRPRRNGRQCGLLSEVDSVRPGRRLDSGGHHITDIKICKRTCCELQLVFLNAHGNP